MEDLLPQICQIVSQKAVSGRYQPESETEVILFDRVPCRLDTTAMFRGTAPMSTVDEVGAPNRIGGQLFLVGDYGTGLNRRFNEENIIKLEGYNYNILAIHDVFGADELHHYELEIYRGVRR